jgi:hypothetical protein
MEIMMSIFKSAPPALGSGNAISIPVPPRFEGYMAFLSTIAQGDMTYDTSKTNRDRFYSENGIQSEKIYSLPLAHSRKVVQIDDREAPDTFRKRLAESGGADGGIFEKRGMYLSVTVADCMPIWVFDNSTGKIALLHSGWKGTGILEQAVKEMMGEGSANIVAKSIHVVFGPCIGPCCYSVPAERAKYFIDNFGASSVLQIESEQGLGYYLDLRRANLSIAERLHIGSAITIDCCTSCSPILGSYRREGPDTFTRMLAIVGSED